MTSPSSSPSTATSRQRLSRRLASLSPIGRGLLVCVTIALATTFIADHYGGPTLLYALLFGMTLHFLSEQGPCLVGVEFAARTILRLGVALLGVRITLEQVAELGIGPVVTVVAGAPVP